jgi:hypothetical protein
MEARYLQLRSRIIESIGNLVEAVLDLASEDACERALEAVRSVASSQPFKRGPGRPPKKPEFFMAYDEGKRSWVGEVGESPKPRKPRKIVYCPMPGCKGVAAPIFGMACAKHKDVPRKKIARHFEERRKLKAILGQIGEI